MEVLIRSLVPEDWPDVARIYQEGIDTGDATFETEVPDWGRWDAGRHPTARIVAVGEQRMLGFATVSPVSKRTVYRGVAEVMVYVASGARGKGVGRRLMDALVHVTEDAGIWTLQASIFPRTKPPWPCTRRWASGSSEPGNASPVRRTAGGGTL